tara:strand:+ start:1605 stop:1778 length:174 start_codon:yes stop_codon:yes gene_type:complete
MLHRLCRKIIESRGRRMSKYSYETYREMLVEDNVICCTETTTIPPYFKALNCDCEEE